MMYDDRFNRGDPHELMKELRDRVATLELARFAGQSQLEVDARPEQGHTRFHYSIALGTAELVAARDPEGLIRSVADRTAREVAHALRRYLRGDKA